MMMMKRWCIRANTAKPTSGLKLHSTSYVHHGIANDQRKLCDQNTRHCRPK